MKPFEVYPLHPIQPVRGKGCVVFDEHGNRYLDLYGGHAVISIGHGHPQYVESITEQLNQIGFYSNSVINPLQEVLAAKLGELSGYNSYNLFLCNSGAESNENAFKVASFNHSGSKIVAVKGAFHGRTSLAVAASDNPLIQSRLNKVHEVVFVGLDDVDALENAIDDNTCAVIIEGIQGVAGIYEPGEFFLNTARKLCDKNDACLIVDEVQSGYGRTGKFFAHQFNNVKPDLITIAKGMGNGYPVAGVLISPRYKAEHGLLGTTFGGNHLACAVAIAVLDVIQKENLMKNAERIGNILMAELRRMNGVTQIRGRGLMIGVSLEIPCAEVRKKLLFDHGIFTGNSADPHTIRILPPLTLNESQAEEASHAFEQVLNELC